jgi:DNA-binding NarL/FixJ family response regulator
MNLSNKEIASLCNISSRGVEQSKYRLKKRLDLDKNEDLTRFISLYKSQKRDSRI